MRRKKHVKKNYSRKKISSTKMMFLGLILLFIVFEALYIMKSQHTTYQSNSLQKQVAGESIER